MFLRFLVDRPKAAIVFHILLGMAAKLTPLVFGVYFIGVVFWGIAEVFLVRDRLHCAARYALYVMSLEITYRLGGVYLGYEAGKYGCAALFLAGLLAGSPRSRPWPFLCYLLLLLPAITLTDVSGGVFEWRKAVLFNLSGPLLLGTAGMYFFGRRVDSGSLWEMLRLSVLPSLSLLTVLFLGPAVGDVEMVSKSNFELSGGFGPNQVATALGLWLTMFVFAWFHGKNLTAHRYLDYTIAALVLVRGLLTFSRGGVMTAAFAIICLAGVAFFRPNRLREFSGRSVIVLLGICVAASLVFLYVNKLTDNWLLYRYKGLNSFEARTGVAEGKGDYLAHRGRIAEQELTLFFEGGLTGIGVGMAKQMRSDRFGDEFASHSEWSRLLAEHGLFGLVALLLVVVILPFRRLCVRQISVSREFFVVFFIFGVATAFHAAMRMAIPGVIIGFSFAMIARRIAKMPRLAKRLEIRNSTNSAT